MRLHLRPRAQPERNISPGCASRPALALRRGASLSEGQHFRRSTSAVFVATWPHQISLIYLLLLLLPGLAWHGGGRGIC